MIHYHGTPVTPESAAIRILTGRHAIISFATRRQIEIVATVCQSFIIDNGAFSFWTKGIPVNWESYYEFIQQWRFHPAFDWALIPDVIDGGEKQNDDLLEKWPFLHIGVPVWHLHESLERLVRLCCDYPRIAFGSSGEYSRVNSPQWKVRMADAMDMICPDGKPMTKLHGLRMLNPNVFGRYPFSSCDSTNVARNIKYDKAWKGTYLPPNKGSRGIIIADRVESRQSAACWGSGKL